MPRLEGGANNTSKIGLIVLVVLVALGLAWYALSGSQNAAVDNGATPASSGAGSQNPGSPPPPPDDNTAALPDNTGNTTDNMAGSEIGGDVTPAPGAMNGDAMSAATPMIGNGAMDGADAMATPAAGLNGADGAGVTMTPAGNAGAMSNDQPARAPAVP